MNAIQALLEQHGLSLVFLNVLLEQAGVPLPAYPILLVAGALGMRGTGPSIAAVLAAVVVACLIADSLWYFAGKRLGAPMLRTICKVSLSQDSCIRQTQSLYLRLGPRSLVFSKLLPGAGALSTAMAGMTGTRYSVFLFYDAIGAVVWAGGALMVGAAFHHAIDKVLDTVGTYGHMALLIAAAALVVFLAWRWHSRRRLLRRTRLVPRMSVDELEERRLAGRAPLVLDVRAPEGAIERIPGALLVDPDAPFALLDTHPQEGDVVIYCACPNELSAAILAERLVAAGYANTWALAGGYDAWKLAQGSRGPVGAQGDDPAERPAVAV
ncbi:DedA family protein/thiosulfate sulfurtransferase GlpE [Paracidovorax citrulli]